MPFGVAQPCLIPSVMPLLPVPPVHAAQSCPHPSALPSAVQLCGPVAAHNSQQFEPLLCTCCFLQHRSVALPRPRFLPGVAGALPSAQSGSHLPCISQAILNNFMHHWIHPHLCSLASTPWLPYICSLSAATPFPKVLPPLPAFLFDYTKMPLLPARVAWLARLSLATHAVCAPHSPERCTYGGAFVLYILRMCAASLNPTQAACHAAAPLPALLVYQCARLLCWLTDWPSLWARAAARFVPQCCARDTFLCRLPAY